MILLLEDTKLPHKEYLSHQHTTGWAYWKGGDASHAAHEPVHRGNRSDGGDNSGFCRSCHSGRRLVGTSPSSAPAILQLVLELVVGMDSLVLEPLVGLVPRLEVAESSRPELFFKGLRLFHLKRSRRFLLSVLEPAVEATRLLRVKASS